MFAHGHLHDPDLYAQNVRRAHDLKQKAQQLASEELAIMNQAVDLNLLAKQLAEATMRPNAASQQQTLPVYISLPAGVAGATNAMRMQLLQRPQTLSMPQSGLSVTSMHQASSGQVTGPIQTQLVAGMANGSITEHQQQLLQASVAAGLAAAAEGNTAQPLNPAENPTQLPPGVQARAATQQQQVQAAGHVGIGQGAAGERSTVRQLQVHSPGPLTGVQRVILQPTGQQIVQQQPQQQGLQLQQHLPHSSAASRVMQQQVGPSDVCAVLFGQPVSTAASVNAPAVTGMEVDTS
eukprot:GHRR01010424.1.p2 GENE.GHRR01010424.1~~GHRR01010424.1.p2  ORF type:complete len:293 (+),score=117.84 GHRR01010424.1:1763-2641(+)